MRVIRLLAVTAMLAALCAAVARADASGPPWGPATPNFNLEVILRPAGPGGRRPVRPGRRARIGHRVVCVTRSRRQETQSESQAKRRYLGTLLST